MSDEELLYFIWGVASGRLVLNATARRVWTMACNADTFAVFCRQMAACSKLMEES